MHTVNTTTRRAPAPRLTLGSLLKAMLDRLAAADGAYRARQKLRRLDDRMLRDVGLTRADAEHGLR